MGKSNFNIQRPCEVCGAMFTPKTIYSRYCSKKCADAAYRKRKIARKKEKQREQLAEKVPVKREYISISEAVVLFGVSRDTLYRLVRKGNIPAVNLGKRLTRISRAHIEAMLPQIKEITANPEKDIQKPALSFEPEDCYTIEQISEKFGISLSTVSNHIRKHSIPTRQIGRFVYVPKPEIDKLYKQ